MPFFAHRCQRCQHPDYWSPAATRAESVTAGMTVQGVTAAQWTLNRGGARLLRASCGMSKVPGYRQCVPCRNGCSYDPAPFVVGQMRADGSDVSTLFEPGAETTGAEHFAGKVYACSCDACKAAYAAESNEGARPWRD